MGIKNVGDRMVAGWIGNAQAGSEEYSRNKNGDSGSTPDDLTPIYAVRCVRHLLHVLLTFCSDNGSTLWSSSRIPPMWVLDSQKAPSLEIEAYRSLFADLWVRLPSCRANPRSWLAYSELDTPLWPRDARNWGSEPHSAMDSPEWRSLSPLPLIPATTIAVVPRRPSGADKNRSIA